MFLFELSCKINQFKVDALDSTCYEKILAYFCSKRYIAKDNVVSAWQFPIEESMLQRIKNAQMLKRQLGEEAWSISIQETEAFVSLLYGREAYVARKLSLKILW